MAMSDKSSSPQPHAKVDSSGAPADAADSPLISIQKRIATALLLICLIAPFLWYGGWMLTGLLIVLALQMNREWEQLIPEKCPIWRMVGVFYITIPIICLIILRDLPFMQSGDSAFYATLYPILIISFTDIFAFIFGKSFGGPKIAPAISPKKRWSGAIGGLFGAVLIAVLMVNFVPWPYHIADAVWLGGLLSVLAQLGDFFESFLKRRFNVKDTGTLLPGHGGVLDRLDSYIFVLPVYLIFLLVHAELML
jgi:phosphatidate cytidylyltransferase